MQIPYQDTYCVLTEDRLPESINPSNGRVKEHVLLSTSPCGQLPCPTSVFPFLTFGKACNSYVHGAQHVIELATLMTAFVFVSMAGYSSYAWLTGHTGYPGNLIPFISLLCFLSFPFVPFIPPHWTTRISFGLVLSQVALAVVWPFFGVHFVHVLIGDALTSASLILWNVELGICYSISGFLSESGQCDGESINYLYVQPVILMLPFWIRFVQCIYRYTKTYQHKSWVSYQHIVNAGKYLSCLLVVITSALNSIDGVKFRWLRWMWLGCLFVKTFYCYAWDIKMDWDLGHLSPEGAPRHFPALLREETFFQPFVYYTVMITNLIMRFSWATALSPHLKLPKSIGTLLALVEIVRRAQWFIFRTENEFFQLRKARRMALLEETSPPQHASHLTSITQFATDSTFGSFEPRTFTIND